LLKNFLSFPSRAAKSGFWLYALHLWSVFGIALSNIFFGLTALVAPRAVRGTSFQWRRVKPVLVPLALYAAFVLASIPFSYDPLWSLSAGRHLLSLASLFLALVLVRGGLQVRQVIDGLVIVTALVATYDRPDVVRLGLEVALAVGGAGGDQCGAGRQPDPQRLGRSGAHHDRHVVAPIPPLPARHDSSGLALSHPVTDTGDRTGTVHR
jgi:hypothetical protein